MPELKWLYLNIWLVIGDGGSKAKFVNKADADLWATSLEQTTGQKVIVISEHIELRVKDTTDRSFIVLER